MKGYYSMYNALKNPLLGIGLAALIVVGSPVFATTVHAMEAEEASITMSASASGHVLPDTAVLTVGVRREGSDSSRVQRDVSRDMREILSQIETIIREAGFDRHDIVLRTNPIRVNQYRHNRDMRTHAFQELRIEVRNLDDDRTEVISRIVDAASQSGGNTVNGPHFMARNIEEITNSLRQEAAMKALGRARAYLSVFDGVELGSIIEISERNHHAPQPMMRGMAIMESMDMSAAPPIEIGEEEISVSVTIRWSIVQ